MLAILAIQEFDLERFPINLRRIRRRRSGSRTLAA